MKEPEMSPAPWPIQTSPTSPRMAPRPTRITASSQGSGIGSLVVATRYGAVGQRAPRSLPAAVRCSWPPGRAARAFSW